MTLEEFLDVHGFMFKRYEHAAVMTVAESESLALDLPGAKTKNLFFLPYTKEILWRIFYNKVLIKI